jgi:hypothetical protein
VEEDVRRAVWAFHFMNKAKDVAHLVSSLITHATAALTRTSLLEVEEKVGVGIVREADSCTAAAAWCCRDG